MTRIHSRILIAVFAMSATATVAQAQGRLFGVDVDDLVELDPTTGAVIASVPITGGSFGTIGALAYDAGTDTLFATSTASHNLWTLDYTTGGLTLVGGFQLSPSPFMHGLEVDDTGQLYGHSLHASSGARFFSIDRITGQASPISNPGSAGYGSLAFVPSTGTMYLANTDTDELMTIDRTTGARTVVGPYASAIPGVFQLGISVAYHHQLGLYAVDNSGTDRLFRLDLATGNATFVASLTTGNLISLAFVGDALPGITFCAGDGSGTACPCANQSPVGAGQGCLSSLGVGGEIRDTGVASLANDTVVLLGTSMPNSSALYFQGTTRIGAGAGIPFGDGLRCVGGAITRLGTATNASGASQYPFGALPPVSVKGNVTVPGTRTYQVWYRNAAAFCTVSTFNLTNGRALTWSP